MKITVTHHFIASHSVHVLQDHHKAKWVARVTVSGALTSNIVMTFEDLETVIEGLSLEGDLNRFMTNPTVERVAIWIAHRVQEKLPEGVSLSRGDVEEEPGRVATYEQDRL